MHFQSCLKYCTYAALPDRHQQLVLPPPSPLHIYIRSEQHLLSIKLKPFPALASRANLNRETKRWSANEMRCDAMRTKANPSNAVWCDAVCEPMWVQVELQQSQHQEQQEVAAGDEEGARERFPFNGFVQLLSLQFHLRLWNMISLALCFVATSKAK